MSVCGARVGGDEEAMHAHFAVCDSFLAAVVHRQCRSLCSRDIHGTRRAAKSMLSSSCHVRRED